MDEHSQNHSWWRIQASCVDDDLPRKVTSRPAIMLPGHVYEDLVPGRGNPGKETSSSQFTTVFMQDLALSSHSTNRLDDARRPAGVALNTKKHKISLAE